VGNRHAAPVFGTPLPIALLTLTYGMWQQAETSDRRSGLSAFCGLHATIAQAGVMRLSAPRPHATPSS
jgi:hypothetical protein